MISPPHPYDDWLTYVRAVELKRGVLSRHGVSDAQLEAAERELSDLHARIQRHREEWQRAEKRRWGRRKAFERWERENSRVGDRLMHLHVLVDAIQDSLLNGHGLGEERGEAEARAMEERAARDTASSYDGDDSDERNALYEHLDRLKAENDRWAGAGARSGAGEGKLEGATPPAAIAERLARLKAENERRVNEAYRRRAEVEADAEADRNLQHP